MGHLPTVTASHDRAGGDQPAADPPAVPRHARGRRRALRMARAAASALPAWVLALVLAPRLAPGGTASPWDPAMPHARAMWFTAHQLVGFEQVYLGTDPASGMIFPLSSVGAGLTSVMAFGSWFGWQLVFLAVTAGSLSWLLARCAGLSGWRLALGSAAVMALTAPARAAVGQGTLDLLMVVLVVAGVWPRRRRSRRSEPVLGVAAAVWLGPLVALAAMIGAGRRRAAGTDDVAWRRRGGLRHTGLVALAVALLVTLCALLVLPWATNDFWWLVRRGAAGVPTGLDPSLGARAGLAGWLAGGVAGVLGTVLAVRHLRAGRTAHALSWLCLVMVVSVPAQFAGQGVPALVTGLLALRLAMPRLERAALLVWAGWTCLVPLDLVGSHWAAGGPLQLAVVWAGPLLGCLAIGVGSARAMTRRPRR